jgi:sec-independent protein translocase protein TatC
MKTFYFKKYFLLGKIDYLNLVLESPEHLVEFRDRLFQFFFISLIIFTSLFFSLNIISDYVLRLIPEIQFFQLSPQDFFLSTLWVALNFVFLSSFPHFLKSLIFFFSPSLILNEKKNIFPLIGISLILSLIAIYFSSSILAPVTFRFFLEYNLNNIEPFWSFNDFSAFLLKLIYITLLLFQLPLLQILVHLLGILNVEKMVKGWKLVICLAFFIGGIVTPSTDPFTQFIISIVIYLLYGTGIFFSKIL